MKQECPCGSGFLYTECCEPLHNGAKADSAEAVMRARYSAYALEQIHYLEKSTHPDCRDEFDLDASRQWAASSHWNGIDIRQTKQISPKETLVEFVARYETRGTEQIHHEIAKFELVKGNWYFSEGELITPQPYRRPTPRIGRNDPCPCGSGKKHKKCCYGKPDQEGSDA